MDHGRCRAQGIILTCSLARCFYSGQAYCEGAGHPGATMIGHGTEKFIGTGLIATSAARSWTLLTAEIRSHAAGEIGAFTPQNGEITQVIRCDEEAISDRASGGVRQEVKARSGTMWLCPAGIREEATRLSVDFHECLHVYMPHHTFLRLADEGLGDFGPQDLRYEAGV